MITVKGHACDICGKPVIYDDEDSHYTKYDFDLCSECKPMISESILKLFESLASRIESLENR